MSDRAAFRDAEILVGVCGGIAAYKVADLVSKLVNRMPEDGIPLSQEHYDNYFLLLVVAGNETTRQAISHSMKALMDNPDQMQWLLENPDKYQTAIEELIRWASPVYHFRRTATKDVEIHGKQVKAGDKLFQLDLTTLSSRLAVAKQGLVTAEAEYRQSAQQAVFDPKSKAQLAARAATNSKNSRALLCRLPPCT